MQNGSLPFVLMVKDSVSNQDWEERSKAILIAPWRKANSKDSLDTPRATTKRRGSSERASLGGYRSVIEGCGQDLDQV